MAGFFCLKLTILFNSFFEMLLFCGSEKERKMKFNYQAEKMKFDAKWKELQVQYESVGNEQGHD